MIRLLLSWILLALSIMICAYLLPGIHVTDFVASLWAALGLGVINAFIRPLVLILTLPVNILTLGLLTFVINALLVILADKLVDGFAVDGFWWALLFSLVLSVINGILNAAFNKKH